MQIMVLHSVIINLTKIGNIRNLICVSLEDIRHNYYNT